MTCDAKIRPLRPVNDTEIGCQFPAWPHDWMHLGVILDYAWPGSRTEIRWAEDDRRNFRGDWHACDDSTCTLPSGHRGDHA